MSFMRPLTFAGIFYEKFGSILTNVIYSSGLYMRLFYTEEFLGWNSEDWSGYLFYSVLAVCFISCILLGTRQYQPNIRPYLPNGTIFLFGFICTPLLIGLFFAGGRVTMLPIPK